MRHEQEMQREMEETMRMEMEEAEMRRFKAQPILKEYETQLNIMFISIFLYFLVIMAH